MKISVKKDNGLGVKDSQPAFPKIVDAVKCIK